MRRGRVLAAAAAAAMFGAGLTGVTAVAAPSGTNQEEAPAGWLVLAEKGADTAALAAELEAAGATIRNVNTAIGLISVDSADGNFRATASSLDGVQGVAADQVIGVAPQRVKGPDPVERENVFDRSRTNGTGKKVPEPPEGHDPLDGLLWGMEMIRAVEAHKTETGRRDVTVGILDTGVQADHLDIAPNFNHELSKNFAQDIPAIDGPCESEGCLDPATEDDGGHGTHVAGTIGAALNDVGVSGVAPDVSLVNIRGGQDSGYFFLAPTVDALTYAGDVGIDVVNMSFYVDPWLYNCLGGAPEDSDAAAADQDVIIAAMNRALEDAHDSGVTLVGALGNNHEDLSNPRNDFSSPDYDNPDNDWDNAPYERTIDNDNCWDLPVEGPHVLGVSALGPSGTKSDFSNYATDLTSGEIELSAPGGWYRDGYGTKSFRTNGNMILSTVPLVSLTDTGEVDEKGKITHLGRINGVIKQCVTETDCDYYAWYQGTSMAAPHASGVAALAVSAHGTADAERGGLTLAPDTVRSILMDTATDHACPEGGVIDYLDEGRSDEFTATCEGTDDFNSFYGAGIVNAVGAVS